MISRLGGLTLSVLLHAGLIGLLLAWSATDWSRPLFVDLDQMDSADPGGGLAPAPPAAGSPAPPGRAARPVRARARADSPPPSAPARAPEMPLAAPPPTPVAPPPAPSVEPVTPVEPPSQVAAAPSAAPPPVPAPPAPSAAPSGSAPPSSAPDARGGAATAEPSSRGRAGGSARSDAESGPGGAAGSPLALATPGSGSVPAEYGPYLRSFRQRVLESLVYPLAARRQGLAGTVELHVWLEPTGRVRDVQIARSSSHGMLDEAAVETVRRLGPVPFPDSLPRRPLLIRLPLVFDLR